MQNCVDHKYLEKLLEVLCCPCCNGDLIIQQTGLFCKLCNMEYPYENGILKFCLSKDNFVNEEEVLFEKMKTFKDSFSAKQWSLSKDHFVKTVLSTVNEFSSKVVLHIGCGVDIFSSFFNESLLYFSVDITEEMLKSIDTQNAPNKFRIHCSVEALPFKQNSIDVILCIDLIHHFYSRGIYQPLQQLLRCLKAENGFLFLEEVNKYALYRIPYSFLPLKLLNILRTFKAVYKKHLSKPATYEAPLSIFKVRFYLEKISKELNKTFKMEVIPTKEYPNAGKLKAYIYSRKFIHPIIHKYLGFHWFIIFSTGIKKI